MTTMTPTSIRPPFTRETATAKVQAAEDAWNSRDPERVSLAYTEDAKWRNRAELFEGRDAIVAALSQYWRSSASVEHDLLNIYGDDSSFVLEALNHYERHDGIAVTLRAVACTERDAQGRVTSVRLYTDTGPLFGAATAAAPPLARRGSRVRGQTKSAADAPQPCRASPPHSSGPARTSRSPVHAP